MAHMFAVWIRLYMDTGVFPPPKIAENKVIRNDSDSSIWMVPETVGELMRDCVTGHPKNHTPSNTFHLTSGILFAWTDRDP